MSTFPNPTRIAIVNESFLKQWLNCRHNRLMNQSIPHGCFVNLALFWITDCKWLIHSVLITATHKISLQILRIPPQVFLIFRYIRARLLTSRKLFPSRSQCYFGTNCSKIEGMNRVSANPTPPPTAFPLKAKFSSSCLGSFRMFRSSLVCTNFIVPFMMN